MYMPGRKFLLFFLFPVIILIDMVYYIFVGIYYFSYLNYTAKTTASIHFSVTCSRSFCRLLFTAPFIVDMAFCTVVIVKQPSSDNTPYEKIGDEVRSPADEVPFDIPDSLKWGSL